MMPLQGIGTAWQAGDARQDQGGGGSTPVETTYAQVWRGMARLPYRG